MRSFRLKPLTERARLARSLLIVGLLLGSLFPGFAGAPTVAGACLLAAFVIAYDVWRMLPRIHPAVYFVVPLFSALAVHALFIPPSTAYGLDKLLRLLTVTLASAMSACLLRDRPSVIFFARTWVAASVALALFALVDFSGTGRAVGFGSNPIWLGRAFATAALVVLWLWWTQSDRRWVLFIALSVLLLGVLATGSRGPIVAFIVGCIPLILRGGEGRRIRVSVFGGTLATMFIALQVLPVFSESRLTDAAASNVSSYSRQFLWGLTGPVILNNPLGVGFGNWGEATGAPKQYAYPHNIFLEVTAELGVIAGLVLVTAIGYVIVSLVRSAKSDELSLLVLALVCAETAAVSVSGDLNARTLFFLIVLGFLVARRREPIVSDAIPRTRAGIILLE